MSYINWTDNEKVNVQSIDDQHFRMTEITNQLYRTLGTDQDEHALNLLKELVEELRTHFDTEEKYMKDYKFTSYISHKLEHDRIYNKMRGYQEEVEEGTNSVHLEMINSLKKWFFNHLDLNDKKLGDYLVSKGVK